MNYCSFLFRICDERTHKNMMSQTADLTVTKSIFQFNVATQRAAFYVMSHASHVFPTKKTTQYYSPKSTPKKH